jgi:GNAT superfamily N-acetyltransferase
MTLTFQRETLTPEAFVDLLQRAGLAERRPVGDRETIRRMVEAADLMVTARDDGRLVGLARALTDFAYCCYLSDLAVDRAHQGRGIGRALVEATHRLAGGSERVSLILLSAPDAMGFYPRIGMTPADNAFVIRRKAQGR